MAQAVLRKKDRVIDRNFYATDTGRMQRAEASLELSNNVENEIEGHCAHEHYLRYFRQK